MVIPRIGMEVVVEFLEGDPDKPLVTGCVYNGKNDVPYELPKHKTRSTFKTDTHQGQGFNELRFEDKAGEEEIFMHAENNTNLFTKNDFARITDRNFSSLTNGLRHEVVSQSSLLEVNKSYSIRTGQRRPRTSLFKLPTRPNDMMQIGEQLQSDNIVENSSAGDFEIHAEGDIEMNAIEGVSIVSGDSLRLFSKENFNFESIGRLSLDAGKQVEIGATKSLTVRSAKRVRLTTGAASIEIDANGKVTIKGAEINLSASGDIVANGRRIEMN